MFQQILTIQNVILPRRRQSTFLQLRTHILPVLSSSRREAASFFPTVRLIELWIVFLILRGVLAMLMSSCRMWLYTSRRNSKSEAIWLLRVEKTTEGLDEQLLRLLQHVWCATLRGERNTSICNAFWGVTCNTVHCYTDRKVRVTYCCSVRKCKDGEKNFWATSG